MASWDDRIGDAAHAAAILREERAGFLARPSVMLGLVPIKDGNAWSVLYGENLMEGVCGFGNSPDQAMVDFDKHWIEELPKDPKKESVHVPR